VRTVQIVAFDPPPPIHLPPLPVGPDTFVLRCAIRAIAAPFTVAVNSMVIRGAEPVIVDTGIRSNQRSWLADLTSLVDPAEVRWVFLSHDGQDHTGALAEVLELCANATLVTSWAATERMTSSFVAPRARLRWVSEGGSFDIGDRTLLALRPPVYDSPGTRALFDPTTGVLWASDAFATPMPAEPVGSVEELPTRLWEEGMAMFHHHALCPWISMVDRHTYADHVRRVRELRPSAIVGAHTPMIAGPSVGVAFDYLAGLPDASPPPHPDQRALIATFGGT